MNAEQIGMFDGSKRYKIRKPKRLIELFAGIGSQARALECWQLMGFADSDFDKAKASGVSNSQLYKQAGNSIVVQVLEAIFKQMTAKVEEKI